MAGEQVGDARMRRGDHLRIGDEGDERGLPIAFRPDARRRQHAVEDRRRSRASRRVPCRAVVVAGVPRRRPLVYHAPFGSFGITLRFAVRCAARSAASAWRPFKP